MHPRLRVPLRDQALSLRSVQAVNWATAGCLAPVQGLLPTPCSVMHQPHFYWQGDNVSMFAIMSLCYGFCLATSSYSHRWIG